MNADERGYFLKSSSASIRGSTHLWDGWDFKFTNWGNAECGVRSDPRSTLEVGRSMLDVRHEPARRGDPHDAFG